VTALLECRGVEVAYGSVQILFGIDLQVERGEIVALLGTNGAGKSTLLKAVSGLVSPMGGSISLDGQDISRAKAVAIAKMGVVHVPGGKATFPTLTVAEHFTVGAWLLSTEDKSEVAARVEHVLGRFPRLKERWASLGGNLSGGEQQQLALAMAFVARPTLLVIDELSLGLAPAVVAQLLEMVREIHALGCTIIIVEQSLNVALTLAERAYFLEKGEVRFSGRTADLMERGDILRSVFLAGAGEPVRPITTTDREPPAPVERQRTDEPVLEVRGLSRSFGGIRAVDDVSFTLHRNEVLGLIGPNGAGKTTVFDLVSGIVAPDAGQLLLEGVDVTGWSAQRRAAAGLGRSFQDAKIFPGMTVSENIALALERHLEHRDHLAAALALPAILRMEDDIAYTVRDLLEMVNLGAYRNTFVSELSTGTRRIVDLAMSIAHDPAVLLLDEPSSGVAQRETEALGPMLRRIQAETGCALLVIEHDMPLLSSLCDELVALDLGAVVTQGTPSEVLQDPRVVNAYLGGDLAAINRSGAVTRPPARRRRPAGART
jgi:ABC-type branched-subunit amino acid transport system ATPase component